MVVELGSLNVAQDVYVKIGAGLNSLGKWYEIAECGTSFTAWDCEEYLNGISGVAETLSKTYYDKPSDVAVAYKERYKDRFSEDRVARWFFVQAGYGDFVPVVHEHFTKGGKL